MRKTALFGLVMALGMLLLCSSPVDAAGCQPVRRLLSSRIFHPFAGIRQRMAERREARHSAAASAATVTAGSCNCAGCPGNAATAGVAVTVVAPRCAFCEQ